MVNFRQRCILYLILLASMLWVQGGSVCATDSTSLLPETAQEGNIYEVSPDGTKDFVTIQEGVDHVESGSTLLIYPGIYEENVIIGDKTVNLIGVNPQYCILTANSDNYHNVPLTIAAGQVSNLTICGTSIRGSRTILPQIAELPRGESTNVIYAQQDQYPGYAVHVDHPYSAGRTLSIENCRIISENNYCIGLGCWDSTEITVSGCEMIAGGIGGCVFIHNTLYFSEAGKAYITIKDSSFKNYVGPYVISIHSEGKCNPVDLTFQNTRTSTVAYEYNECYNVSNVNNWFNIDQLRVPGVQTVLVENGYLNLSEGSQLVHQCTAEQHRNFNKALEKRGSLLKGWPQLAEGITYWESAFDDLVIPGRMRHTIDMKNFDGVTTGDGWCGLSGIYLTKDSYGNTLPEMNYPRTMTGAAAE